MNREEINDELTRRKAEQRKTDVTYISIKFMEALLSNPKVVGLYFEQEYVVEKSIRMADMLLSKIDEYYEE